MTNPKTARRSGNVMNGTAIVSVGRKGGSPWRRPIAVAGRTFLFKDGSIGAAIEKARIAVVRAGLPRCYRANDRGMLSPGLIKRPHPFAWRQLNFAARSTDRVSLENVPATGGRRQQSGGACRERTNTLKRGGLSGGGRDRRDGHGCLDSLGEFLGTHSQKEISRRGSSGIISRTPAWARRVVADRRISGPPTILSGRIARLAWTPCRPNIHGSKVRQN